jgi:hypothetical protein
MNKITHLTDNAIAVEVPDDSGNFDVAEGSLYYNAAYYGFGAIGRMKKLPPGKWKILGLSTELTEEQCEELVEQHFDTGEFKEYVLGFYQYRSAKQSFESLLRSKGIVDRNPYDHLKLGMTFSEEHQNKWQQAQQQVKKYLILVKHDL